MHRVSALDDARGGVVGLAFELAELATEAQRAARYATGEYIPQMSRDHELVHAFRLAGRIATLIEHLAPRVMLLDGAIDGLVLVRDSLVELAEGRDALRQGASLAQDPVDGTVADAMATSEAARLFAVAATHLRAIADLAILECTPVDELYEAITGVR